MEVDLLKAILESDAFKEAFKESFSKAVMCAELNTLQSIKNSIDMILDFKKTRPDMTADQMLMLLNEYFKMCIDYLEKKTNLKV